MRPLPPEIVSWVDELNRLVAEKRSRAPADRTGDEDRMARILAALGASGHWTVLPRIMHLALVPQAHVALAARAALAALAACVPMRAVGWLDRALRARSPYLHGDSAAWHELEPPDLDELDGLDGLDRPGSHGRVVSMLAMCHPSGHVRERALRRWAGQDSGPNAGQDPGQAGGLTTALLLVRVNDWVRQVREVAVATLRSRLHAGFAADLVAALPVVDGMAAWGRMDAPALRADIDSFLASDAAVPALRQGFAAPVPALRRACLRRALASPAFERDEVLEVGLADADTATRLWSARLVCAQADSALFEAWLPRLVTDPLGAIRLAALEARARTGRQVPAELVDRALADRALLDEHAGVRACARAMLARLDDTYTRAELAARYRAWLGSETGRRRAAALAGLGETGSPADADQVRGFLQDPMPCIRRAALRGLARLCPDEMGAQCLAMLCDASPGVARVARDLLLEQRRKPAVAQVWAAFLMCHKRHGRTGALAVLAQLDHWQQLPCLLHAARLAHCPARERAVQELHRWLARQNRCFTRPSRSDVDAIRAALSEVEAAVPESLYRAIRAVVDSRAS